MIKYFWNEFCHCHCLTIWVIWYRSRAVEACISQGIGAVCILSDRDQVLLEDYRVLFSRSDLAFVTEGQRVSVCVGLLRWDPERSCWAKNHVRLWRQSGVAAFLLEPACRQRTIDFIYVRENHLITSKNCLQRAIIVIFVEYKRCGNPRVFVCQRDWAVEHILGNNDRVFCELDRRFADRSDLALKAKAQAVSERHRFFGSDPKRSWRAENHIRLRWEVGAAALLLESTCRQRAVSLFCVCEDRSEAWDSDIGWSGRIVWYRSRAVEARISQGIRTVSVLSHLYIILLIFEFIFMFCSSTNIAEIMAKPIGFCYHCSKFSSWSINW